MFNQLIESSTEKPRTKRPFTLVLALAIHVILVWVLLLIPIVSPQSLSAQLPQPTAVKPLSILIVGSSPVRTAAGPIRGGPAVLRKKPLQIPRTVNMVDLGTEPVPPFERVTDSIGGFPGGSAAGIIDGVIGVPPRSAPVPPPPSVPPELQPNHPVRVGGEVQQANLISQVKPQYPIPAKQAGIQGAVFLEAVISREGAIVDLKMISGHPLLIRAAMDAVKHWRYKPTLLNKEPVEVSTTITVNFSLGR
jgi:protein TonB